MVKRKLAQLLDSDDEDEDEPIPAKDGGTGVSNVTAGENTAVETATGAADEEMSDEEAAMEVKPVGDVIRRSGRGKLEKRYYEAFELDGNRYELEDPVLVTPEERNQKPYVAIIKEVKQSKDGTLAIIGQWFYRPEEASKKGGGTWVASDARELFYSFHRDEVAAESVMHKCVVHFIPSHKQAPPRSKHPGFIVRKVYDAVERKLWKLTDKDYEDSKQSEIELLVQKTRNALGDLPDIELEETADDQDEAEKGRRQVRRRPVQPININKEDNTPSELPPKEGFGKPETPGSCIVQSEGYKILQSFNSLTNTKARDRWLEKLLMGVKYVCKAEAENVEKNLANEGKLFADKSHTPAEETTETPACLGSHKTAKISQGHVDILWPEDAITAVTGLEKIAFDTLGADLHKYNLKMRQLEFNLKNSTVLAQRFLKKELDASKVLNMSPAELKDGLTAEEKSAQEPEEPETMQMADVRCGICGEKKVGVRDIIHGGYGDRYQLECLKCGNTWFSSRDSISSLTIQTVNPKLPVGTAPWATSKFEDVEKDIASPREIGKGAGQEGPETAMTAEQHNGDGGKQAVSEAQATIQD